LKTARKTGVPKLASFSGKPTSVQLGLFHFYPDPERQEAPDAVTLNLDVDDRVLTEIIRNLYYPTVLTNSRFFRPTFWPGVRAVPGK